MRIRSWAAAVRRFAKSCLRCRRLCFRSNIDERFCFVWEIHSSVGISFGGCGILVEGFSSKGKTCAVVDSA